jgi:hypothetical protein
MKKVISLVFMLSAFTAVAGPTCTKEPKNTWQDQKTFQENLVKEGYKIKKFKVTSGDCYEIYGWNKEGKKVEIYFSPVDGKKIKEEIN